MSSSNVSGVTSYFPSPNEGFTTTTSGPVTSGAPTVGLNSTSGLTDGKVFVGIIEPGTASEQTFTGTVDVSNAQITGVVWTRGSNVAHGGGVTIVDYVTGTAFKMITAGILASHNQDGTPKPGITYPASTFVTPTIASFLNANHTHANAAGGGQLGFSALLSTIFSGQIVTGSNAGTAGGSTNFLNLGGLKLAWGETAALSLSGSSQTTGTITFPTTFASAPMVVVSKSNGTSAVTMMVACNSDPSATQVTVELTGTNGSNTGTAKVMWLAIGT